MLCCLGMTMVLLDNLIHDRSKGRVRVMRASIDTDTRVCVLATRENASLEWITARILLVLKLIPNIAREELAQEGTCSIREDGITRKVID